jgi:membrane-associated HD superfamily phosphohydrolase
MDINMTDMQQQQTRHPAVILSVISYTILFTVTLTTVATTVAFETYELTTDIIAVFASANNDILEFICEIKFDFTVAAFQETPEYEKFQIQILRCFRQMILRSNMQKKSYQYIFCTVVAYITVLSGAIHFHLVLE